MPRQVFVAGATGYIGRHLIPVLLARGHRVRALARRGSEATGARAAARSSSAIRSTGRRSPAPSARATRSCSWSACRTPRRARRRSSWRSICDRPWNRSPRRGAGGIAHFVYVSVAQPAPVMQAYQHARRQAEQSLAASGLTHTVLRPWYVLGPGHRWPYLLLPAYWMLERLPANTSRRAPPRPGDAVADDRGARSRDRGSAGARADRRGAGHHGALSSSEEFEEVQVETREDLDAVRSGPEVRVDDDLHEGSGPGPCLRSRC